MKSLRHSHIPERFVSECPTFANLFSCLLLLVVSAVTSNLQAQTYTDMHDFNCKVDGCGPTYAGIVGQGRDGNLYGTTQPGTSGGGTIYTITPSGAFNVIFTFNNAGTDGFSPTTGLTLGTDGNFYGGTATGGANGFGTLFKITPAGVLTTLHDFTSTEAGFPYGPPVAGKNGTFYGVTRYGKAWSLTQSGTFKLLPNPTPGESRAPLTAASDGNLYGTTINGGTGNGTVFQMSTAGKIKIIYNFDNTHGAKPIGPVVQGSDGFLYGTASTGGSIPNAFGVVFKLSTKGAITVLHEFDSTNAADGYEPLGGLVEGTDGNFYGTTWTGKVHGVIFKITKSGTYTVLYAFDGTHGSGPATTQMQNTNGIIYGATVSGGVSFNGVFYNFDVGMSPFLSLVGFPAATAGKTVQILGQGLTGTTSVRFGSGSATFNVVSDTYMTAVVPASGTTGTVTVTTPGGTLKSKQVFKVVPMVKSFSPTSGPVGTQVTITGSGFTGASKVTFGGVKATTYTVDSGTQITAIVPTGAVTGKIAVTTTGGTASKGIFVVN
ncbi:MAG: choice-of-anchor tandem repeat GloVer-containing protein [Terriglobales bacterium]